MSIILERIDLASLNLEELTEKLREISEKSGVKIEKFRSAQIYGWLSNSGPDRMAVYDVGCSDWMGFFPGG